MAHRKRRKPTTAEVKAAADRAESPVVDEPATELVPIDPAIERLVEDEAEAETIVAKMGRPTEYDPACLTEVKEWAAEGLTDFEIAENLGVTDRTLYRWKAKHREFRQALRIGKLQPDRRVEQSLYHSAIGYKHRAVKIMQYEGAPVIIPYIEQKAPDVGAIKLWLTNRQKERWADTSRQEHTGKGGGPVEISNASDLEFGRRLLWTLAQARKAAAIEAPTVIDHEETETE